KIEMKYPMNSGPRTNPKSPINLLSPMPRVTCDLTPSIGPALVTLFFTFSSIYSAAHAIDWPKNPEVTPMIVIIVSRTVIDVDSGMIATRTADVRIAANSGLCIPYAWVTLPEKNELTRLAADATVSIIPTSKTEIDISPYANIGIPVV